MPSLKTTVGLILCATALTGCTQRITDFTIISTKNLTMDTQTKGDKRVTGTDCGSDLEREETDEAAEDRLLDPGALGVSEDQVQTDEDQSGDRQSAEHAQQPADRQEVALEGAARRRVERCMRDRGHGDREEGEVERDRRRSHLPSRVANVIRVVAREYREVR